MMHLLTAKKKFFLWKDINQRQAPKIVSLEILFTELQYKYSGKIKG